MNPLRSAVLLIALAQGAAAGAQSGALDPTFAPFDLGFGAGDGAGGGVSAIAEQPDGKILIGGSFIRYNATPSYYIARLDPDGVLDAGFDAGWGYNDVKAIALQPDGRVVIGGFFTTGNGAASNRVARLEADGTNDPTFDPGTGGNGIVNAVALRPDGRIIIAGNFTAFDGSPLNRVAQLNPDGSLDGSFNPGMGADDWVSDAVLQPDGRLLVAGNFANYDGVGRNRIARLNTDGSLDTSFEPMGGANEVIDRIALQPDGKILIGGRFTAVDGTALNRIARLNADGSLDAAFDPGAGVSGFSCMAMSLLPDGRAVIGGFFQSYDGVVRKNIVRLNTDGSLDPTFDPGNGPDAAIHAIHVRVDGSLLIGGSFRQYHDMPRAGVARLHPDGTPDTSFNPASGANGSVQTTTLLPDGKVLITGSYYGYNGILCPGIARLNTDGAQDFSFDPGAGADGSILAVALQPDGKLILAGSFSYYNGVPRNKIARVNADGSLDMSFNPAVVSGPPDPAISDVALLPDGKLIVIGNFNQVNGGWRQFIARLNADGSLDTGFPPIGINYQPFTVAIQPDGKIFLGGMFFPIGWGIEHARITRLNPDGTVDTGFDPGTGADGLVHHSVLQPDGRILISGTFTHIDGIPCNGLARLNADGSVDPTFDAGAGPDDMVYGMVLQPDGKILVAGDFTQIDGQSRARIARIHADGALDMAFDPGNGANAMIRCIGLQQDGKVIAGGDFTAYDGIGRNRIARVHNVMTVGMAEGDDGMADIMVFPNPASTWSTLRMPENGAMQVTITDATGRSVQRARHQAVQGQELRLDVSQLSPGLYAIELVAPHGGRYAARLCKE